MLWLSVKNANDEITNLIEGNRSYDRGSGMDILDIDNEKKNNQKCSRWSLQQLTDIVDIIRVNSLEGRHCCCGTHGFD